MIYELVGLYLVLQNREPSKTSKNGTDTMSEQENIGKPTEYELKYAEQIQEAVRTGRAQRAPDGTIILDPTKNICPTEYGHFRAQREYDLKRVARILSNVAYLIVTGKHI